MKLRIVGLGLTAVCAIALGGAALAQNVPEQFVVSGKNAEKIQDFSTINLATAERIATACEKLATDQGVQISIMVLDPAGNHVYMDRMDGQGYLNIITADMKARTALALRSPSKTLMNAAIEDPTRELQFIQLGEFANSGGLPIVVNKQLIGVVGVGGSAPRVPVWSDEICAQKAMTEVIGPSVAPLVKDLPPRQNANAGNAPVPRFATATPPKSTLPAEFVVSGKGAGNQQGSARKIEAEEQHQPEIAVGHHVAEGVPHVVGADRREALVVNDRIFELATIGRQGRPTQFLCGSGVGGVHWAAPSKSHHGIVA